MWRVLAAASVAALFGLAVGTGTDVRLTLFNSDILLPAAVLHDLARDPGDALRFFQLPRVPSFFPDLLALGALSTVMPWRAAMLGYEAASFAALVLLCGTVASRWSGRAFGPAAAAFGALAALAMLGDLCFDHIWGGWFPVLFPVDHSGSLLCTFGALLLLRAFARHPRPLPGVALLALCAVATVSDRLFVGTFLLPGLAALAVSLPRRRAVWPAAVALLGCAAGFGLDRLVFGTGLLLRQPDLAVDPAVQAHLLPALLHDPHVAIEAVLTLMVAIVPAAWSRRDAERRFWWAAATAGCVLTLGFLPAVYADWTSFRYVQPAWWWPVVVASVALLRFHRPAPSLALGTAVLAAAGAWAVRDDIADVPGLLRWRLPLEACLSEMRRAGTIHAGIAGYWNARAVEASSDWTLPMVHVLGNGRPHFWGINLRRYTSGDDGQPPRLDFVVPDQLEPDTLRAHYGPPRAETNCAGLDVWLYDPGLLRARLAAPGPRSRLIETPAAFLPETLFTLAGRLAGDGVVPPLTAPDIATFGPYAPLAPERWRLVARLDLSGAGPHRWEAYAAPTGPVLAGGRLLEGARQVVSAPFDMPAEPHLFEFRTFAAPGDHLALHAVGLCPATLDEAACIRQTLGP